MEKEKHSRPELFANSKNKWVVELGSHLSIYKNYRSPTRIAKMDRPRVVME